MTAPLATAPRTTHRVIWPAPAAGPRLTPREITVLGEIASGYSNQQIGRRQGITRNTVKTYVAHILQKLGARDRAHAVGLGVRAGLVDPSAIHPR